MLEVVDREPQRLVALQEPVEDRRADHPDARAAAARGDLGVEVVAGEGGLQLVEQPAERHVGLLDRGAGVVVEMLGEAREAGLRLLRAQEQLAVAAVLGGVERHGRGF